MASGSVAKLAALVPLLIIIIILCVFPAGESRIVSPHVDDNAPTTTKTTETTTQKNLIFAPGVVMIDNRTARAEDDCSFFCTDEGCQTAFPDRCGPHPDPNYCWVGCLCEKYNNYCTCLCTA